MSRTSTAVRRSTKRWVSRSCSASDKPRFDLAGPLGPFGGLGQPVGAVGDVGPAAHPGEPVGERLDVAVDVVEPRDLGGEPFVRDVPALADVGEQPADHSRVVHRPDLAEIGQAACGPQPAGDLRRVLAAIAGSSAISLSTARSIASGAGRSNGIVASALEAGDQRLDVGEIEVGIAPVDAVERPEAMLLDRRDFLVAEGGAALVAEAERAEAAVALVAAGAAGDLRHFGDGQAAVAAAVELFEPGEGDMGRRPC